MEDIGEPEVKSEEEEKRPRGKEEEEGGAKKKQKKEEKKDKKEVVWEESGEEGHAVLSQGRNQKRVTVSKWKGTVLVGIREYYNKDDQWLPGKSGISLTLEQWEAVMGVSESITALAKKLS